jgi:SAM-dependent methyltransferase
MERIAHHYEVEKELAARLKASTRGERSELFQRLYGELFERVPDHPRAVRREQPEESERRVAAQLRLLEPFLGEGVRLVEFAPGDCSLAHAACGRCAKVIGIDISDQRSERARAEAPANFELVVYDGYECVLEDGCADVVFSCMFLEHLHPDDVPTHLELAFRLLRPGGTYVISTPHRYSGPHDVSRHFGDELVCFHFQEWTTKEMIARLKEAGFGRVGVYRGGRLWRQRWLVMAELMAERVVGCLPRGLRKRVSRRLFRGVVVGADGG